MVYLSSYTLVSLGASSQNSRRLHRQPFAGPRERLQHTTVLTLRRGYRGAGLREPRAPTHPPDSLAQLGGRGQTESLRRPRGFPRGSANRVRLRCRRPWFDSCLGKIRWRRERLPTPVFLGFPGKSDGKEPACNAGDLGLRPGLGISVEEERFTTPVFWPEEFHALYRPWGKATLGSRTQTTSFIWVRFPKEHAGPKPPGGTPTPGSVAGRLGGHTVLTPCSSPSQPPSGPRGHWVTLCM